MAEPNHKYQNMYSNFQKKLIDTITTTNLNKIMKMTWHDILLFQLFGLVLFWVLGPNLWQLCSYWRSLAVWPLPLKGAKVLYGWLQTVLTIETGGNPPSSIRSALKAACSNSLSLASFCLAALWASDLEWKLKKNIVHIIFAIHRVGVIITQNKACLLYLITKQHYINLSLGYRHDS